MLFMKNLLDRISGAVPANKASPVEEHDKSSIGKLLVEMGRVSPRQLSDVLISQSRATDEVIGAELQRLGWASSDDIATAIDLQTKIRNGHEDKARLEIVRIRLGEALEAQKEYAQQVKDFAPIAGMVMAAAGHGS